jgi:hypothetical protein
MPALEKDQARYIEIFEKPPPDATIKIRAPEECPAFPPAAASLAGHLHMQVHGVFGRGS